MNKAFVIILAAFMTGGWTLMEGDYGEIDVFALRCS